MFLNKKDIPDKIIVPYVDDLSKVISIFGSPFLSIPWSAVTMKFSFHYRSEKIDTAIRRSDFIQKIILDRLLKSKHLTTLFSIDEILVNCVQRINSNISNKIAYLPDPTDLNLGDFNKFEAKDELNIPKNNIVILVYGFLDLRKGIIELLNAYELIKDQFNISLLFAGCQPNDVQVLINNIKKTKSFNDDNIIILNKILNDEEEKLVFQSADIVWVGYNGFLWPSGVLIQAGKAGLPVISCKTGWIGWKTKKEDIGVTVDISNPEEISTAIKYL